MIGFYIFIISLTGTFAYADSQKIIFEVPKMMCGACTSRVTKSIESHPGVSDTKVSLDDHSAKFSCDAKAGCDLKKIKKDLSRIQYPAKQISPKE